MYWAIPFMSKENSHIKSWEHLIQFFVCGLNLTERDALQKGGFAQSLQASANTEACRDVARSWASWYFEEGPLAIQASQFDILSLL